MKKVILAPDSFKGTLSSKEITSILKEILLNEYEDILIYDIPLADGGENTLSVINEALNGKYKNIEITGPNFNKIKSKYLIKNNTAFIESAECVGLHLCTKINCMETTTFGIGEQIIDAIKNNCDEIIITVGGTSTNDLGLGMLNSLGMNFYDINNNKIIPIPNNLDKIIKYDFPNLNTYKNIKFKILSDVKNELLGLKGATYTYAKQKGASIEILPLLEEKVKHITKLFNNEKEKEPSTGAGGGIVYGLKSFFNCEVISGIDYILDIFNFDEMLNNTDYVITGEGKIDNQTENGKVIYGICNRSKNKNVKVIALAGIIDNNIDNLYQAGLTKAYSINEDNISFEEAKKNAKNNLTKTFTNICKTLW